MFFYCEQCASIENIKNPRDSHKCKICEYELREVPSEYLMSNGSFFKSQDDRQKLIALIKTGEKYSADFGENKESIKAEKDVIEKEAIAKRNEELKAEQESVFSMECPACHSKSISKISNVGKIAKVYAFGLYGAGDLGKTYKCNICGCKF